MGGAVKLDPRKTIFNLSRTGCGAWLVMICILIAAGSAGGHPCTPGMVPDVFVYAELDGCEIGPGQFAVVVEKGSQELHIFAFQGRWRLVDTWPCSTGKRSGPKRMEGDFRTPEGIYFTERYIPGRYLSDIYGACALPLNYPNWLDRKAQRTGSAIWLHGTDKKLKARDSNGCVVLDNDHIKDLATMVKFGQTPIIIVDRINWWRQRDADRWAAQLKDLVDRWQDDLMGGSYRNYKQWYAPGASATMDWWHRWCRLRNAASGILGAGRAAARNFNILRYDDIFFIQFDQHLEANGGRSSVAHRRLFVKLLDGHLRIIGESDKEETPMQPSSTGTDPLFAAWRSLMKQAGAGPTGRHSPATNQDS